VRGLPINFIELESFAHEFFLSFTGFVLFTYAFSRYQSARGQLFGQWGLLIGGE
jgi:hypothetical protein